jgi:hypothetical protein
MEAEPPDGLDLSNVFPLFDPASRRRPFPATRSTTEELAEYRRIRPMLILLAERAPELMAMMREWQVIKGPEGCPVMSSLLPPE